MTTVLQCNLGRGWTAQNLLHQYTHEHNVDICVISEQHSNIPTSHWLSDTSGTAAVWVVNPNIHILDCGRSDGFAWIKTAKFTLFSCYLSPNQGISIFREKLGAIEDTAREIGGEIIIAGDLNAKSTEWGMSWSDTRGDEVADTIARLDLVILNTGSVSTFRRPGCRESILDISLATPDTAARISRWEVLETYSGSDHQYIQFIIATTRDCQTVQTRPGKRWNPNKLNESALIEFITERSSENTMPAEASSSYDAEKLVEKTMNLIVRACDSSMPRRAASNRRRPNYWWTDEIADLRKKCLSLRRKLVRANGRRLNGQPNPFEQEFTIAKKDLKQAIKNSKIKCWKRLCNDLDNDLWGRAYQIVTKSLGKQSPVSPMEPETMKKIVDDLFPRHPPRMPKEPGTAEDIPPFTVEEVQTAARTLKTGKAPGPDGIPSKVIKLIAEKCPQVLLTMYNACLKTATFSKRWKLQRLVLLDKGKGPPVTSSSYRPLCMLDVAGKLLEKLIKGRLMAAVERADGLSQNQHGFRKGHSTLTAIEQALTIVRNAWSGNHRSRKVCIFLTFDVKNAFNSMGWEDILEAMREDFAVDGYIQGIADDYFRERVLRYDTTEGPYTTQVTAGSPQGSVLGPDCWNIRYDDLLRMDLPEDIHLIGYADDVAGLILADSPQDARQKVNHLSRRLCDWLRNHHMQLAASKTEMVVLTRQRWFDGNFSVTIDGTNIEAKHSLRYLGLQIDEKLTFREHLDKTADKAGNVVAALSRIMLNTSGPRYAKRRLLLSTVHSIMLYGSEIWADRLSHESYRRKLATIQRRAALRVTSSYRTVSEAAVLVISKAVPIDLMAYERRELHRRRTSGTLDDQGQKSVRERTVEKWQERWQESSTGRWTAELIPDLKLWTECRHAQTNYYLTQLLTGHGFFNQYLYRMGIRRSPLCSYCANEVDDARHTFFYCSRWTVERNEAWIILGEVFNPSNIISLMANSETSWSAVMRFAEDVLKAKKAEEYITAGA